MKDILKLLVLFLLTGQSVYAQESGGPSAEELAKANNPLADMTAFNVQYYYRPVLNGLEDAYANTNWYRFAMPTGPVLWRLSAPLETRSASNVTSSGFGDLDLFGAYLAVSKPDLTFGIGPSASFPTASKDELGSGKYTLGAAAVVFAAPNPQFQYGALVIWRTSIAGDEDRAKVNFAAVQPFYFWQLGEGTYLRGAPIMVFDIESGDYHVPLGLGIGKVVKVGGTVFNFFFEPQYTVLVEGVGQPLFQIYTAVNMQF
jgi:hypothetical protein